jgi:monofunctional biosynthetic peptidoglycan transglycosylase
VPFPKVTRGLVVKAVAAAGFSLVAYVYLTLPDVRSLSTTNPASTAFMDLRDREAAAEGRKARRTHRWVPYSRISPNLKRAVLVAEDSAFWDHDGIDIEQIRRSIEDSLSRGEAPRGASTITQQLAKNLYLSPSYDPLRKLRELVITRRLETALSKARIFEIYLNVIEWGDQVWGAEAAARTYFGVSASSLSRSQAALLAGAIINPRLLNPARPTRRLLQRQQIILARMGSVDPPAPARVARPEADAPQPETPAAPAFPPAVDEAQAPDDGQSPDAVEVEDAPALHTSPPG